VAGISLLFAGFLLTTGRRRPTLVASELLQGAA
jgi:hypothetical protein